MAADVDIDTPTAFKPERLFPSWPRAAVLKGDQLAPHPCGVHPQAIAVDPLTKLAAIPYDKAEALGYAKVDFLHLWVYDHVRSREELDALLEREPPWELLLVPAVQATLFQLAKHGDLLSTVRPRSLEELADCLALIRPGKRQLLKLYLAQREATRKALYAPGKDGYSFKRSHAFAYALVIVLQLNLLSTGALKLSNLTEKAAANVPVPDA